MGCSPGGRGMGMVGNATVEGTGPGDISVAAGGGWGGCQLEQGTLCRSLRSLDHRRPSVCPHSPTRRSLTWDCQCFRTPCAFPLGDGAGSLGGCQGGLTAAQVKGARPRRWWLRCRLCPGPASAGESQTRPVSRGIGSAGGWHRNHERLQYITRLFFFILLFF